MFSLAFISCQKESVGSAEKPQNEITTDAEEAGLDASINIDSLKLGGVLFMDSVEYSTLPQVDIAEISSIAGDEVSERSGYKKLNTPPVRSQGGEGSCTAFAAAYCVSSYYASVFNNWSYTNEQALRSPEYIYNSTKAPGACNVAGAYLGNVFNFMKTKGVCSWSQMPYSDANGCSTQPNSTQISQGAIGKIASWNTVAKTVSAVKNLLNLGYPVMLAFDVNNNFINQTFNYPYTYVSKSADNQGGHAVTIVGYDDSNQRLIVQNSWGNWTHDQGFFYISYSLFPSIAKELYVTIPIFPGKIKIRNTSACGDVTFNLNGTSVLIHSGQTIEMPAYLASNSCYLWECIWTNGAWDCKWDGNYALGHSHNYKIIDKSNQWDLKLVGE